MSAYGKANPALFALPQTLRFFVLSTIGVSFLDAVNSLPETAPEIVHRASLIAHFACILLALHILLSLFLHFRGGREITLRVRERTVVSAARTILFFYVHSGLVLQIERLLAAYEILSGRVKEC